MVKYSIVIATYNRLEELRELFDSFHSLATDKEDYEIVISDDGSTDLTREFISSQKSFFNIVYLFQKNQGPGAARNYAMSKARGAYFIFIDSDVILPSNYLQSVSSFLDNNDIDAFGGPDTYHPSFSPLLKAINYSMTSFLGTGGTRGSKNSIGKYYPRSFNMGISKEIYFKIGGFGKLRHGQDMDFSARIYKAGFKVGFIEDAFVYHKRRTSLKKFYNQIHNWGVARINLGKMHSELYKPIHFIPAVLLIGSVITFALTTFFYNIRIGGTVILLPTLFLILLAFIDSFRSYKNLKIGVLSVITLFTQIIAYGIGSLKGLFQIYILKRDVAQGITKNYYGRSK